MLLDPNRLPKFVDRLPIPTRAVPVGSANGMLRYRLTMRQFESRLHRDLPPARLWGFESSSPGPTSPGPTIDARSGQPISVEWVNDLPARHLFPIDHSLHGAGPDIPDVRTVIHLHGGRVSPESDGYPEHWFTRGGKAVSIYPNQQDAATLWYHDHAMAITRLNFFAGLFGLYLLRDEQEDVLKLPQEIPLVLYDRSITTDGQLYYPVSNHAGHLWIPEFFGEAILANGKLYPYFDVEPRKYRLRVLNACNSRFCYLSFSSEQRFWQIGTDQGFLSAPVALRQVALAPGERADLIVDFRGQRGQPTILRSDSFAILQFRVSGDAADDSSLPARLRSVLRIEEKDAVKTRLLTLGGGGDPDDPTTHNMPMLLNESRWHDPVTESPQIGSVEIWSFVNLTEDSHPIHLHLVRFQILDRRPFDLFTYLNDQVLRYTGPAVAAEANERGWKDTVRADPGVVTRIIIRFEGFTGRYVWHCHVLEHEDNEMMRPYDVVRPTK